MKALSIRQPWAWAILHLGKDIENRAWAANNPARRFRGEFLIHASSGMTRAEYREFLDVLVEITAARPFSSTVPVPAFADLPRGGIVGRARVVDVVTHHASPWFFGPLGLVLADVAPLPFRPRKGALGFFEVPE